MLNSRFVDILADQTLHKSFIEFMLELVKVHEWTVLEVISIEDLIQLGRIVFKLI